MCKMEKRFPVNGTFELTGRCNLSCKMCLVRVDRKRIQELGLRERTADEWIHMAGQARDAGTLSLLLTGGEVMLRPDFCEIYEAIAKMGFVLTVYTNATMVTDEIMQVLEKLPPHKIGVTMYGASNETYQKLCGCADGYDRFLDGVQRLSKLPSLFDIRTTIVRDNLADLPAMREYVKQRFGEEKVLHISRNVVNAIRGGIACPREVRLTPEENMDLVYPDLRDFKMHFNEKDIPLQKESIVKMIVKHKSLDEGYLFNSCKAGITEYAINWSGNMYACEMLNKGYTKPFEEGFVNAWNHLQKQYPLNRRIEKCESCVYAVLCETCPANRLAETGDGFGIPEYSCREAQYIYQILQDLNEF